MNTSFYVPSTSEQFSESLRLARVMPGRSILVACDDPVKNTAAILGGLSKAATFPVPSSIGSVQAERLLTRVRPGLVVVDNPSCTLAGAAFAAGWRVALLDDDLGLNEIAPARRTDVAIYDENIAILLQTSGTTGEPKLVGLIRENLRASYEGVADALMLGPQDRTLTLMPLTHIHGIVAVLGASLFVNAKVAVIPSRDPDAFWQHVDDVRPTWLSMVPTLLHSILSTAPIEKPDGLNALRFIRTSSSALPPTLRAQAEAYFGVPVLEAYGMTEASHQIASSNLHTTAPGSVGLASKDVQISLRHSDGDVVASGETGEVCIRGPNVMKRYLWPAAANDAAFHEDWFRTGDLGAIAPDGQLRLTGRIKEQINRGGATISPVDIEDAILQQPQIAEAVVFPVPHDTLGEDVATLVVLRSGCTLDAETLQSQLAAFLDFESCPKYIVFADALPKQASSGKVSRTSIAKEYAAKVLQDTVTTATEPAENYDDIAMKLVRIASAILVGQDIAPGTSLFSYGMTSLDVFRLCAHIGRDFGATITPLDILRAPSCIKLAKLLSNQTPRETAQDDPKNIKVGPLLRAIATRQEISASPLRNMATLVINVPDDVSDQSIIAGWKAICDANPMLRAMPKIDGEAISIEIAKDPSNVVLRQTEHECGTLLSDQDVLHDVIDPKNGPFLQPFLVTCADCERCLVVLINQFMADGYAHHILIRQLNMALADERLPKSDAHLGLSTGHLNPNKVAPMDTISPIGPKGDVEFDTLTIDMPAALWDALGDVSENINATPFTVGLAVFSHLLERLSGRAFPVWFAMQKRRMADDFMAIANATRPEFLLTQAGDASLATYASLLLTELLSCDAETEVVPHRDSTPCWFEIANEGENLDRILGPNNGPLKALSIQSVSPGQPGLELSIYPQSGAFCLRYDRELLSKPKAQAMLDGFVCLLENAIAAPDAALKTLASVPAPRALPNWPSNRGGPFKSVIGDFERLALSQPSSIAVKSEAGEVTFAALQGMIDELCDVLTNGAGASPLRVAAVAATGPFAVQSQIAVLAGFLAAQKSNAVFMPVAAQIRPQQCVAQIEDIGVQFVIGLRDDTKLHAFGPCLPLTISNAPQIGVWAVQPQSPADLPAGTEVIYSSSGTTGPSKRICSGADRFVDYFNGLASADLITAMPGLAGMNVSFDIWMYDVLYPLLSGHCVIMVAEQRRTPDVLKKAAQLGARNLSMTPSVAAAALEEDRCVFDTFSNLYLIGEPLSPTLSATLSELAPRVAVFNSYGTTETGVAATLQPLDINAGNDVYLGKAVPGFDIFFLDQVAQQHQPAEWPAEVVIVQPSQRSKYLSVRANAGLEIGLPDGRIAQRTGDIGVLGHDTRMFLLGRRDRQVQINGTRIELDTIEEVAEDVGGVSSAAALCAATQTRIQLYLATDTPGLVDAVRQQLDLHLPRAVRNLDIHIVKEIPLGPTGKKRRNDIKLPTQTASVSAQIDQMQLIEDGSFAARVADVWKTVLPDVETINLHLSSDFYAVGGTSLGMLRVAGQLAKVLECDIPEEVLFANPVLGKQAELIGRICESKPAGGRENEAVLLSSPDNTQPDIRILGLPSISGSINTIGMLAALGLPNTEIWAMRPVTARSNLITSGAWYQLVQDAANWIANAPKGKKNVLAGSSFGGWMSWAIDLELQSRGFEPSTVLCLDGPTSHLNPDRPRLRKYVKKTFDHCANYRPPEMLVFYRAENMNVHLNRFFGTSWERVDKTRTTLIPFETITHRDFSSASFVESQKPLINAFIVGQGIKRHATAPPADLLGFRLFALLQRPRAPQESEIRTVINSPESEKIRSSAAIALLCLALSTGQEDIIFDAVEKIEGADIDTQGKLIDRALVYARMAMAQIATKKDCGVKLTKAKRKALPKNFVQKAIEQTSRIEAIQAIWHLPDDPPILSMKWIRSCFRYVEK